MEPLLSEVKLFDPSRSPANWTDLMQPHQFAVLHVDIKSGAIVHANGSRPANPGDGSCILFSSLSSAEHYCRQQVEKVPSIQCEVYDNAGKSKPPVLLLRSQLQTEKRHRGVRRGIIIGSAVTLAGLAAVFVDYANRWDLVWPTAIGSKVAIAGIMMLLWNLFTARGHGPK